jgi:hypothetical protein
VEEGGEAGRGGKEFVLWISQDRYTWWSEWIPDWIVILNWHPDGFEKEHRPLKSIVFESNSCLTGIKLETFSSSSLQSILEGCEAKRVSKFLIFGGDLRGDYLEDLSCQRSELLTPSDVLRLICPHNRRSINWRSENSQLPDGLWTSRLYWFRERCHWNQNGR